MRVGVARPWIVDKQRQDGYALGASESRSHGRHAKGGCMDVPRFRSENLNSTLYSDDLGDAFQRFTFDVLEPKYPGLNRFPSKGKDGGIDLSCLTPDGLIVFECKQVGQDGAAAVLSRWRTKTAEPLSRNLSTPDGPPIGQSQYEPWFRTDPPIGHYVLCVSAELANQAQVNEVTREIEEFFEKLVDENAHLSHLKDISVEVIHWGSLAPQLEELPHLLYRWFPTTRPQGLIPLGDAPEPTTFREYLASDTLPYYSRAEHMRNKPPPSDVDISDERALLARLAEGHHTGIIVRGEAVWERRVSRSNLAVLHCPKAGLRSRFREDCVKRVSNDWRKGSPRKCPLSS